MKSLEHQINKILIFSVVSLFFFSLTFSIVYSNPVPTNIHTALLIFLPLGSLVGILTLQKEINFGDIRDLFLTSDMSASAFTRLYKITSSSRTVWILVVTVLLMLAEYIGGNERFVCTSLFIMTIMLIRATRAIIIALERSPAEMFIPAVIIGSTSFLLSLFNQSIFSPEVKVWLSNLSIPLSVISILLFGIVYLATEFKIDRIPKESAKLIVGVHALVVYVAFYAMEFFEKGNRATKITAVRFFLMCPLLFLLIKLVVWFIRTLTRPYSPQPDSTISS